MNVCLVKESLGFGGTECSVANISRALQNRHNVYMTLFDGSDIKFPYGGELIDFAMPPRPTILGKIINTFNRHLALKKVIKHSKVDILFLFTGIGNVQTGLKYRNTKKIISARDFGGMMQMHEKYRNALANSDGMICNSNYLREFYLSKYPEDTGKVFTVYNIIDREEILRQAKVDVEPEFEAFLEQHAQTVVSVGRFCKEKGFEYLIESLAKARETQENLGLVLVGDGEYLGRYEEIIGKFGLEEHIYKTGFQKNPYKYMARCNCYVLSSLSEGFPNVLAEAMALGLPVISTNCYSGPAEILRNDGDYESVLGTYQLCDYGIITPRLEASNHENAVSQMAKAMVDLLSDGDLMEKYAALATERAACFSSEAAAEKLDEIFNLLMKQR